MHKSALSHYMMRYISAAHHIADDSDMTVTTLCCVQDFGIFVLLMNTVASYVSGFVLVMVPAYGEHLKAPPWVFVKKKQN